MSLSDPIADMLTRIRNASQNKAKAVVCRNSKVCRGVAEVLEFEGYIKGFEVHDDGHQGSIHIDLKYGPRGEIILHKIKRESKPGRRLYTKVGDVPSPVQGLGISIVSTSSGVLSDRQCREKGVGGELLCTVS